MSSILSVHGWLDIDPEDLDKVKFMIKTFRNRADSYNLDPELLNSFIDGWVIQQFELNGTISIFYGRVVKSRNLLFLEEMLSEIVTSCGNASGFFKFENLEDEYVLIWDVKDGNIIES